MTAKNNQIINFTNVNYYLITKLDKHFSKLSIFISYCNFQRSVPLK